MDNLKHNEKYKNLTFFPGITGYFIFAFKPPLFCSVWMNWKCFLHGSEEISAVIIFRGTAHHTKTQLIKPRGCWGSPEQDHNHNKDVKTAFHPSKGDKRYQQADDVAKPLAVKLSKLHHGLLILWNECTGLTQKVKEIQRQLSKVWHLQGTRF